MAIQRCKLFTPTNSAISYFNNFIVLTDFMFYKAFKKVFTKPSVELTDAESSKSNQAELNVSSKLQFQKQLPLKPIVGLQSRLAWNTAASIQYAGSA